MIDLLLKRPEAEVVAAIDAISAVIAARMDEGSALMLGLMPAAVQWATPDERTKLHALRLELPSYGEAAVAARARILARRASLKRKVSQ